VRKASLLGLFGLLPVSNIHVSEDIQHSSDEIVCLIEESSVLVEQIPVVEVFVASIPDLVECEPVTVSDAILRVIPTEYVNNSNIDYDIVKCDVIILDFSGQVYEKVEIGMAVSLIKNFELILSTPLSIDSRPGHYFKLNFKGVIHSLWISLNSYEKALLAATNFLSYFFASDKGEYDFPDSCLLRGSCACFIFFSLSCGSDCCPLVKIFEDKTHEVMYDPQFNLLKIYLRSRSESLAWKVNFSKVTIDGYLSWLERQCDVVPHVSAFSHFILGESAYGVLFNDVSRPQIAIFDIERLFEVYCHYTVGYSLFSGDYITMRFLYAHMMHVVPFPGLGFDSYFNEFAMDFKRNFSDMVKRHNTWRVISRHSQDFPEIAYLGLDRPVVKEYARDRNYRQKPIDVNSVIFDLFFSVLENPHLKPPDIVGDLDPGDQD